MIRAWWPLVLVIALLLGCGCGGGNHCTVGMVVSCACAGGGTGVQTCGSDGTFSSCQSCGGIDGGMSVDGADTGPTAIDGDAMGGAADADATSGVSDANCSYVPADSGTCYTTIVPAQSAGAAIGGGCGAGLFMCQGGCCANGWRCVIDGNTPTGGRCLPPGVDPCSSTPPQTIGCPSGSTCEMQGCCAGPGPCVTCSSSVAPPPVGTIMPFPAFMPDPTAAIAPQAGTQELYRVAVVAGSELFEIYLVGNPNASRPMSASLAIARFDAPANAWTALPETIMAVDAGYIAQQGSNALQNIYMEAVWDGNEILVTLNGPATPRYTAGARYNVASGSWAPMATVPAYTPAGTAGSYPYDHFAWVGGRMIGVVTQTNSVCAIASYDPVADAWTSLPTAGLQWCNVEFISSGGRLFALGTSGAGQTGELLVFVLDAATMTWSTASHSGIVVSGPTDSDPPVWLPANSQFEIFSTRLGTRTTYDPGSNTWSSAVIPTWVGQRGTSYVRMYAFPFGSYVAFTYGGAMALFDTRDHAWAAAPTFGSSVVVSDVVGNVGGSQSLIYCGLFAQSGMPMWPPCARYVPPGGLLACQ